MTKYRQKLSNDHAKGLHDGKRGYKWCDECQTRRIALERAIATRGLSRWLADRAKWRMV